MTDPAASALRFDAVSRHFGRRPVLQKIRLSMAPGERVALRGPNGSGKTTLLRLAATLLRPTAGTVEVGGVDTRQGHAARRGVAYLAQDAPCYAELTPAEHLRWWSGLHGHPLTPHETETALAQAGLARHAHRPAAILSRGQRQRLAICLGFAASPRLLLLDEPFTALDETGTAWLRDRLEATDAAVLAALHGDAPGAWDRTLTLDGGRLL